MVGIGLERAVILEERMNVSMIENWANILGQVLSIDACQDMSGFDQVELLVESVEAVEGYPNLVEIYLEEAEESHLWVLMPAEVVQEHHISQGVVIACRVRRAGPDRIFAHRDHIVVYRPE